MPGSDDRKRDIAGRFMQTTRNKTFEVTKRLFPEHADEIIDKAQAEVEDFGLQKEGIEVILEWFRSEADAEWLEEFRQSPHGERFIELSAELMMRATARRFAPHVPLPPPGKTNT